MDSIKFSQDFQETDLKQSLDAELPKINQALAEAIQELPPSCQPMARHIISAGGKRLRPWLVILFARLFGKNSPGIYRLAGSMELLHAATLLHDDVLDNASLRRGQPAAHCVYGSTATILAGDAMLALGNAIVAEFNDAALCLCFSQATSQTAAGEILEIDNLNQPGLSLPAYIAIATGKTGNLLAQSCKLGALYANAPQADAEAAHSYGENLGVAFQIIDDCLDFSQAEVTGKPVGGDLKERKITPPIFLFRKSLPEAEKQEFDAFFTAPHMPEAAFSSYIQKISAFAQEARTFALPFIEQAQSALASLPLAPEKEILSQILETAIHRQK